MKTTQAGLAILTGLAAIVTADSLPPEDIPLQCATICGPIVELTSICDVHRKRLRKRKVDKPVPRDWAPKLAVEPLKAAGQQQQSQNKQKKQAGEKRSFSVIVAAPTSFPPELLASATTTSEAAPSSSSSTRTIRATSRSTQPPTEVSTTSSSSTNPRSTSSSTATSRQSVTTSAPRADASLPSTSFSTAASRTTSTDGYDDVWSQKGQGNSMDSAEEQCVCLNDSFDVEKVAGLCASCIQMAGYTESNMDVIMSECNFTSQTWSPSKDKVVDNVRVRAERPSTLGGSNAAMTMSAATMTTARSASLSLALGLVGVVLGATMLL